MNFYQGKKVLVTGHTGFKGGWLCEQLLHLGADVYGYALPPENQENLFDILNLERRMHSHFGDVRNCEELAGFLKASSPEIVFHLAAKPIVRTGYRNPVDTYETNVMGTVYLLEAARQTESVRSLVNVTTDKVYENREWCWGYRETDNLGGKDPYSSSKACSELVTKAYTESFLKDNGVSVSTVRAGNVIGGGDFSSDRILPDCFRAARQRKPIAVRNPHSIRPYQHVLEALNVYLKLAAAQWDETDLQGSYNVGPDAGDCVSTGTLADAFCQFWGDGQRWDNQSPNFSPYESGLLRLDHGKLTEKLGWKPLLDWKQAVCQTVSWYQAYRQGEDMQEYTLREIAAYEKRLEEAGR